MEEGQIQIERLDPETEFLLSKRQTGNEWELFKENVRPLKRGRKVHLLNEALKSHNDNQLKKSLLENRRFYFLSFFQSLDYFSLKYSLNNFCDWFSSCGVLGGWLRLSMSIKEMILYNHGWSEYSQLLHFSFPIFLLDFIISFEEICVISESP